MKQFLILLITAGLSLAVVAQNDKLIVPWPESWKIFSKQKTQTTSNVVFIPGAEKIDNWSILGTQTSSSIRSSATSSVDAAMKAAFNDAKKNATSPILTVIDKKEDEKTPWILFKIEGAGLKTDHSPESFLYYVIAGDNAVYSNSVAIKQATLPTDFTNRWTGIFKSSQFIKQPQ